MGPQRTHAAPPAHTPHLAPGVAHCVSESTGVMRMSDPPALDVGYAQALCDLLAAELGYVCSFMAAQGRIVASSERTRIGQLHSMAARVMAGEFDECEVTRAQALASGVMREGLNMAIDFGGTRVACFAIAGPLQAVLPLARIARFCVLSMLRARQEGREDGQAKPTGSLVQQLGQAHQTIESSLTRLRDAVDNIDQGITVFDAQLKLVVWNRRFPALVGVPAHELVRGMDLAACLRQYAQHAGYGADEAEALVQQRLLRADAGEGRHFEHVRPDGQVLEVQDRLLADGGWVSTYTDVTRRYRADQALRGAYTEAEQRVAEQTRTLKDYAELSADWFWEQDAEFRFTSFSGRSTDKLQRVQTDFFGKRRWDMPISGVTPEQWAAHMATCERHEPFRNFEYVIEGSDGALQHYMVSGLPVFDGQQQFVGYRGTGSNITSLRRAEQTIRERERQLAQIVDGSPVATFVLDAQHRVTHWNRACAVLTGRPAPDMVGTTDAWRAFFPHQRPTLADRLLDGTIDASGQGGYHKLEPSKLVPDAWEAEYFNPTFAPAGRWLFFTAAPLRDAHGRICGALETLVDVSEGHRQHELLEARVVERTQALTQQLHFQRQLIEAIPSPVFYKDTDLRYLGCNSAFERFMGRSAPHIIGKTLYEMEPTQHAATITAVDQTLLQTAGAKIYESQALSGDGIVHDVMIHKATFTRPDGEVGGLVGVMLDITERKRMEDDLRQAATVFDNSAEGVIIASVDGSITAVNRAFTDITGYTQADVLGRNPRMLQSGRHDEAFYRELWTTIGQQGRWQGEVWNRRKSGEVFPQWISISAVRNAQGQLANYVATFTDVTQKKHDEERIQMLAFSDPLTALPNRRLLLDRLAHALTVSARNQRLGALFFIDLDNFKALNDTRGHHVGDLLLQELARRLVACVREGDTVARLGGDEFVLILESLSPDLLEATTQAEAMGHNMLAVLAEPCVLLDTPYRSHASMGVTLFGGGTPHSLDDLLKQADLAMYRAKSSGRNGLRFFDPAMQAAVDTRFALETDLRQGLQLGQFELYYQAQVHAYQGIVGAEVLLRWAHPVRGMVAPDTFITLAEETGLIVPLGAWVLETACAQLADWSHRPGLAHLSLAVNVSAQQFRQADFVEQVLSALHRHRIDAKRLKLELTESTLLTDIDGVVAKMTRLKAHGVGFALDDFGTGYSSLSYLKRLPLDQLKIDRSFVRDVLEDPSDAAISRTIITLAHSLALDVLAEGVETRAQLDFLAAHGCLAYQGYHFSRPLPLAAFAGYVAAAQAASGTAAL